MNILLFRKSSSFIAGAIIVFSCPIGQSCSSQNEGLPKEALDIVESIKTPVFPDAEFIVEAPANDTTDMRDAIQAAIDLCSYKDGGKVIIKPGKYFCKGPLALKSDVNLHLEEGAEILFSPDPEDYLPGMLTTWEGTELINYCSPIYAYQCENVAITGKGILNGQASKGRFTNMHHQKSEHQYQLRCAGFNRVPVQMRDFGAESVLPPSMLQPWGCVNLLLEDFTLLDSPFWCIHPVFCTNVTVRGVKIDSQNLNNDGLDPESCSNVLIENCNFNSYDDCVAIKAGRDKEGWKHGRKSRNIVIRNNYFNSGSGAVVMGSEMAAGVENVYVYNITVPACKTGVSLRGCRDRGGFIQNIWVDGIKADSVHVALVNINNRYWTVMNGETTPIFKNVTIKNCSCRKSERGGIQILGQSDIPVSDVLFENITVEDTPIPVVLEDFESTRFSNVRINGVLLDEIQKPTEGIELPPAKMRKRIL